MGNNPNFYVSLFDVQSNLFTTYEYSEYQWEALKNEPSLLQFETDLISMHLAKMAAANSKDVNIGVLSASTVHRHLTENTGEMIDIAKNEHQAFLIIIDRLNDRESFVFASNPADDFASASDWGAVIADVYLKSAKLN